MENFFCRKLFARHFFEGDVFSPGVQINQHDKIGRLENFKALCLPKIKVARLCKFSELKFFNDNLFI